MKYVTGGGPRIAVEVGDNEEFVGLNANGMRTFLTLAHQPRCISLNYSDLRIVSTKKKEETW